MRKWTYDLGSVFSPESSEGYDIGGQADEVLASTTSDELGRDNLCTCQCFANRTKLMDLPPLELMYRANNRLEAGSKVQMAL